MTGSCVRGFTVRIAVVIICVPRKLYIQMFDACARHGRQTTGNALNCRLVVWPSGNGTTHINELTLHWAQHELIWLTVDTYTILLRKSQIRSWFEAGLEMVRAEIWPII